MERDEVRPDDTPVRLLHLTAEVGGDGEMMIQRLGDLGSGLLGATGWLLGPLLLLLLYRTGLTGHGCASSALATSGTP
jgi:hypothetical protein